MTESERINFNPTSVGTPMGYGGGLMGGGLLEGLLFASLFGRGRGGLFGGGGEGGDAMADAVAAKVVELQTTADIKAEIAAVGSRLEGRIDHSAAEAMKAGLEAKIASLQTTNELANKIGNVETEIQSVKCHVDSKIAASTQSIINHLEANEKRRLEDEIALLRSKNDKMEINAGIANQFGAINNVLIQLANQQEKLTSQVVQFGTANAATPTNTNNQVK